MRRALLVGGAAAVVLVGGFVITQVRAEPRTSWCAGVGLLPDPAPLGATPEEAVAAYAAASRTGPYVRRGHIPEGGNEGFVPDPLPAYGDYPVVQVSGVDGSYRVSGACIESVTP